MDISRLESIEIQKIVCHYKSISKAAKMLGVSTKLLREKGAMSPTEYVVSMNYQYHISGIVRTGSIAAYAGEMGVSVTYMKGYLTSAKIIGQKSQLKIVLEESTNSIMNDLHKEWLQEELKRIKSVQMLAVIYGVKLSLVTKAMERFGIQYVCGGVGGSTTAKGRKAEIDFMEIYGGSLHLIDCNAGENQDGHDFESCLGRLQLKASKFKKGAWVFSFKNLDFDFAVFALYDSKWEDVKVYRFISREKLEGLLQGKKSIRFYHEADNWESFDSIQDLMIYVPSLRELKEGRSASISH